MSATAQRLAQAVDDLMRVDLLEPFQGEWRARAITQQPLQSPPPWPATRTEASSEKPPLSEPSRSRASSVSSRPLRLIAFTPEEGYLFCANAVNIDNVIVMNDPTPRLVAVLGEIGFELVRTPLTEFIKSGGSAKCLTLRIG